MNRDLAELGYCDRIGKKRTPPISRVADPRGNLRSPHEPSRVKCVLQQKRHIEFPLAQFPSQSFSPTKPLVFARAVVRNQLVRNFLFPVNIQDIRAPNDSNLRIVKFLSYRTHRRKRHNRVAYPVRGSNQNFHELVFLRSLKSFRTSSSNAGSGETARAITAT